MGILDSIMYKSTFFLFCLLVLWVGQCQAKPGLLDLAKSAVKSLTDDCEDKEVKWERNECAMVFDDDDCQKDGLKIKEGETPFSRLGFISKGTADFAASSDYKDDIEGIIVRAGCELTVYKESDCKGGHEDYEGGSFGDKAFDDLDDEFDEKIECVKCRCS